jgi:hypothetical protein
LATRWTLDSGHANLQFPSTLDRHLKEQQLVASDYLLLLWHFLIVGCKRCTICAAHAPTGVISAIYMGKTSHKWNSNVHIFIFSIDRPCKNYVTRDTEREFCSSTQKHLFPTSKYMLSIFCSWTSITDKKKL